MYVTDYIKTCKDKNMLVFWLLCVLRCNSALFFHFIYKMLEIFFFFKFAISLSFYWLFCGSTHICNVQVYDDCVVLIWSSYLSKCAIACLFLCALTSFRSINVDLIPIKPKNAFVVAYLVLMFSLFALNIYDNCFVFPLLFFIVAFIVCFLCVLSFAVVVLFIPIVKYHQARNHMSSRIQFELR